MSRSLRQCRAAGAAERRWAFGRWVGGPALALAGLLVSCRTLEQLAPPVGATVAAVGARQGAAEVSLQRGREIYIGQCVHCHAAEPIDGYTLEKWRDKILPDMAAKTKLNAQQTADVTAYVLAARQVAQELGPAR